MSEMIISGVFAIIFSILAVTFRGTSRNEKQDKSAVATITNLSDHDDRVNYYVTIEENGQIIKGKSISYPSSGKSYKVGDIIPVTYHETQNEWVRVNIQDKDLTPSQSSVRLLPKVLTIIASVFIIATIYFGVSLFM